MLFSQLRAIDIVDGGGVGSNAHPNKEISKSQNVKIGLCDQVQRQSVPIVGVDGMIQAEYLFGRSDPDSRQRKTESLSLAGVKIEYGVVCVE